MENGTEIFKLKNRWGDTITFEISHDNMEVTIYKDWRDISTSYSLTKEEVAKLIKSLTEMVWK